MIKYGGQFRRLLNYLEKHQHESKEAIAEDQWHRLRSLVDYAYEHVPFYKERFDNLDIHPSELKSREDFGKIPVLRREEIESNEELLKSDEFDKFKPIRTIFLYELSHVVDCLSSFVLLLPIVQDEAKILARCINCPIFILSR